MHVLTLSPSHHRLEYAAWESHPRESSWSGTLTLHSDSLPYRDVVEGALGVLSKAWHGSVSTKPPAAIGIRVAFGGERFTIPTLATPRVLASLAELIPQAPLHLPTTLALVQALGESLPDSPAWLVFETAFFGQLPVREQCYGLDAALAGAGELRRYGYHGIYHEAACAELARRLSARHGVVAPRMLSLCLEPRPELVAVQQASPVMVTSGATPLEGLPGDTSAGEADPAIVLSLAQEGGLGPEAIHRLLTRESGLSGLCGRPTTLGEVIGASDPAARHALEVFEHRLLLSVGAGIAALGGLDGIVFSGRYAHTGDHFGPLLAEKLARLAGLATRPPEWLIFPDRRDRLVADQVLAVAPKGSRRVLPDSQHPAWQ